MCRKYLATGEPGLSQIPELPLGPGEAVHPGPASLSAEGWALRSSLSVGS